MAEINELIFLLAIQVEMPIRHLKMSARTGDMNLEVTNFFQLLLINSNYMYLVSIEKYLLITP